MARLCLINAGCIFTVVFFVGFGKALADPVRLFSFPLRLEAETFLFQEPNEKQGGNKEFSSDFPVWILPDLTRISADAILPSPTVKKEQPTQFGSWDEIINHPLEFTGYQVLTIMTLSSSTTSGVPPTTTYTPLFTSAPESLPAHFNSIQLDDLADLPSLSFINTANQAPMSLCSSARPPARVRHNRGSGGANFVAMHSVQEEVTMEWLQGHHPLFHWAIKETTRQSRHGADTYAPEGYPLSGILLQAFDTVLGEIDQTSEDDVKKVVKLMRLLKGTEQIQLLWRISNHRILCKLLRFYLNNNLSAIKIVRYAQTLVQHIQNSAKISENQAAILTVHFLGLIAENCDSSEIAPFLSSGQSQLAFWFILFRDKMTRHAVFCGGSFTAGYSQEFLSEVEEVRQKYKRLYQQMVAALEKQNFSQMDAASIVTCHLAMIKKYPELFHSCSATCALQQEYNEIPTSNEQILLILTQLLEQESVTVQQVLVLFNNPAMMQALSALVNILQAESTESGAVNSLVLLTVGQMQSAGSLDSYSECVAWVIPLMAMVTPLNDQYIPDQVESALQAYVVETWKVPADQVKQTKLKLYELMSHYGGAVIEQLGKEISTKMKKEIIWDFLVKLAKGELRGKH